MKRRYHCIACRCDELEVAFASGDHVSLFACFKCEHLFYFMPDAAPQPRELELFELYSERQRSRSRT